MKKLIFFILFIFCGQSLLAQSSYDKSGSIDLINLEEGYVVMRDKAYSITTSTKVYSSESRISSPADLKVGGEIGFRVLSGSNQLSEIWVLE